MSVGSFKLYNDDDSRRNAEEVLRDIDEMSWECIAANAETLHDKSPSEAECRERHQCFPVVSVVLWLLSPRQPPSSGVSRLPRLPFVVDVCMTMRGEAT